MQRRDGRRPIDAVDERQHRVRRGVPHVEIRISSLAGFDGMQSETCNVFSRMSSEVAGQTKRAHAGELTSVLVPRHRGCPPRSLAPCLGLRSTQPLCACASSYRWAWRRSSAAEGAGRLLVSARLRMQRTKTKPWHRMAPFFSGVHEHSLSCGPTARLAGLRRLAQ